MLFVPTLMLGTLLIFVIMRVLPGDVATAIMGAEAAETGREIDMVAVQKLRETLGLNDPLPIQYTKWLWSMVNGNMGGTSLITGEPISEIVALRFPKTAELAIMSFTLAIVMGIPSGILAAVYQDRWPDYLIRVILVGGLSIPSFWLALMIILGGLLLFNYIPPIAYVGPTEDLWGNLQIMILPALIIGFHSATSKARVTRAQILEVMRQDYIRTARSKGVSEKLVLWRHAMKNAMIPVVTIAALQLLVAFSGTVILESIFGIPGMGNGILEAIRQADYPVIQSLATIFLGLALVGNLITDLSYAWLDPRIKYS